MVIQESDNEAILASESSKFETETLSKAFKDVRLPGNHTRKIKSIMEANSKNNKDPVIEDYVLDEKMCSIESKDDHLIIKNDEEDCNELEEKMTRLRVNDGQKDVLLPQTSSRKIMSVKILSGNNSSDDEDNKDVNKEEEDDNNGDLNERGPMTNQRNSNKYHPYEFSPASYSSDSSYSSQNSPEAILQNSPPKTIQSIFKNSGNGGTCSVFSQSKDPFQANSDAAASKNLHSSFGCIIQEMAMSSLNGPQASSTSNDNPAFLTCPVAIPQGPTFFARQDEELSPYSGINSSSPSSVDPFSPSSVFSPDASTDGSDPLVGSTISAANTVVGRNLDDISLDNSYLCLLLENLTPDVVAENLSPSTSDLFDDAEQIYPSIGGELHLNLEDIPYDENDRFYDINTEQNGCKNSTQSSTSAVLIPMSLATTNRLTIPTSNLVTPQTSRKNSSSPPARTPPRSRSNSGRSINGRNSSASKEEKIQAILNNLVPIQQKPPERPPPAAVAQPQSPCVVQEQTARERLEMKLALKAKNHALVLADVNSMDYFLEADSDGDTKLHVLMNHSNEEIYAVVEKFVQNNRSIDIPNRFGQTPLFCPVLKNNPLIVEYLIERGANPGYSCKDGNTPMHLIATNYGDSYLDVARILCQKCEPERLNKKNCEGLTPLHCAVKNCQVKCVGIIDILLKFGAKIDEAANRNGKTALHMAVELGSLELVKTICTSCKTIESAINKEAYNRDVPLYIAARLNSACDEDTQVAIITLLLQHGAKNYKENKYLKQLVSKERLKVKQLFN